MVDVMEFMVRKLSATGYPVFAEELPDTKALRKLPALHCFVVGDGRRRPAHNGLGVDDVDVDVELFISPLDWKTGRAHDVADALRRYLAGVYGEGVRVVDVSRPVRRPDLNPNVRRLALLVQLMVVA